MKPISTSTSTFSNLIESGFVYVDKTAFVRELVRPGQAQYFLSRPRRFGKSLLVSTLKALFQGRRDLFKGLAIDASDYDWKAYPVIHLDMGSTQCDTAEQFEIVLHDLLDGQARANGVELPRGDLSPARRFARLLEILAERSERGKVVILVDEYDKPMLHKLGTPEVRPFRDALKRFYSVIKTCEGLQRFALVTGISKFSKVSIFSDLNNLTDITMMPRYATLLGYTRAEVEANFSEHVAVLGRGLGLSPEEAMARIVHWYDGYRFEEGAERVINPVSLGLCFQNGRFRNYWSSTAVPTFLVDLLEKRPIDLQGATLSEDELDAYEPERLNVKTLLYQTGYLTIAGVRPRGEGRSYVLDFPNAEVRNSFNTRLARAYMHNELTATSALDALLDALYGRDLPKFFDVFRSLFANMPYDLTARAPEQVYQAVMVSVLWFVGVGCETEVHTSDGAIDALFETDRDVYVVEFKRDEPAAAALAQVRAKDYAARVALRGKPVTLLGVSFDSARRTVAEWKAEPARGV